MTGFGRAVRLALGSRGLVAGCFVTSLFVAVLWASNLMAVWPLVDAVMRGQSVPQWLESEAETQRTELAERTQRRIELGLQVAHASPDQHPRLRQLIADSKRESGYTREKLEWNAWVRPIAARWLPSTPFETLVCVCAYVMIGTLLKNLFRVLNLVCVARLGHVTCFNLRKDYYRQLLRLDLSEFSERGRGDLMNRCTTDLNEVGTGVQTLFGQAVREPLKMIACFAGAAWVSWRLLLLTIVVAPIAFFAVRALAKSLKRANRRALEELSGIFETLTETLSSIRLIKAFTLESAERARFHDSAKALYERQMKIARYNALVSPLTENLGIMMVMLAALAGGFLVLNQETHLFGVRISETPLTHGHMTLFFAMLIGMSDPARRLAEVFNRLQMASAASDRVFEVLDRRPTIVDPPAPASFPLKWRSLAFEQVTFGYGGGASVLKNVDLEVRRGERIAIVGPNGCGKSTLLSLLPRFYDTTGGAIRIDGVDVRDLRLRALRSRIGIVSQQAHLFNTSVAENISFGRPGATREEIEAAAVQAHADRFVLDKLEHGYDTIVGPGGSRLSGGQRQRIALARAILRDPEILILDEATSQIDVESERLIHDALKRFTVGRTTLLITHRPSTLTLADRVVVMDHGVIDDIGTADELYARCELFRTLCSGGYRASA
ncbi:putative ABC transporter ATP-binding protein [Pseudobythopirellula maris]|uniref:Putative ABC transporter ATP-binding protein n=1 Tax=Pseudobythopirellula maris TaxID=2527991 RepID=A0A5C5ZP69_9BACT|nr:ABC transporter ATP-binding protein [Pseudobythopirellula maris]TWT88946.1 putative ABC transporter ATP-binding protein [Pseudobythopirellula maris]